MLLPKTVMLHLQAIKKDVHIFTVVISVLIYVCLVLVISFELGLSLSGILGAVILVAVIMFFPAIYLWKLQMEFVRDNKSIILVGSALVVISLLAGTLKMYGMSIWAVPVSTVAIVVTLLVCSEIAIISSLIASVFVGVLFNFSVLAFLFSFVGCVVSILTSTKVKNRHDLTKVGYYIISINVIVVFSLGLLEGWELKWFLPPLLWCVINGVFSVMFASALLPYLEKIFSKTTSMRLLELGDFNQPLLKRLMVEAPGSYHHSLMVASLAESAADVVGANPLLCRVGAYYHDVGKISIPEYFIENQLTSLSKHADLKSQMSSLVVISHVKEGERLMKEYKIDKSIADIVRQHHGTSMVRYFYMRALENGVSDSEKGAYRYPGPCPTTKESAIIMLADSVEAASRAMKDHGCSHLRKMIYKIINNKFVDGQLQDVDLTLANLNKIAEKFVSVLTGIYHSRVTYPERNTEQTRNDGTRN